MIGPILLALSWLLLRLEGKNLSALGVDRPRRRLAQFAIGFGLFGAAAAVQRSGLAWAAGDRFVVNTALAPGALLEALRFVVNSVLYEELVFRGYLLYQAVRFLGPRKAVWLAGAAFGVYHWFSYGVFGAIVPMAYVFLLTGAAGLAWARAFTATRSIAAPIGLHFGWNLVTYLVFSAGPTGPGLLVPASGAPEMEVSGGAAVLLQLVFPIAVSAGTYAFYRWTERAAAVAACDNEPCASDPPSPTMPTR